jgi:hypothetical protein
VSDLNFYQEVINHIAEYDRKNDYHLVPADSIVGALLANCKILATDNKVDPHTNNAIYLKNFSAEYKDVSAILKSPDKGESTESNKNTQYKIPNFDSELFSQSGWRNGSCQAKTTHLPRLLAWYYWKSEKLTQNKLKRLKLDAGFQSARDFHERVRTSTNYSNDSGELVQYEAKFRHFTADLPVTNQSATAGKPTIKRDWIDPYNQDAIPFVGRKAELEQLDEFATDSGIGDFKVWAIIAPSGAGKTRLTYEWIQRPKIRDNWEVSYLGLDVGSPNGQHGTSRRRLVCRTPNRMIREMNGISEDGSQWSNWEPTKPQLFIIDYVFGFEEVIKGIIQRCSSQPLSYPVRLLVLDHKFPEEFEDFKDDLRWSPLSSDGERMSQIRAHLYNNAKPLELKPQNTEDILRAVIKSTVTREMDEAESEDDLTRDINDQTIDEGIEYLKAQSNAEYPLFAAMVGNAIRHRKTSRNGIDENSPNSFEW